MASVTDKKNITLKEKDFPQLDHSKKTKPRTLSSQVSVSCLLHSPRSSFICVTIARAVLLRSSRQPPDRKYLESS